MVNHLQIKSLLLWLLCVLTIRTAYSGSWSNVPTSQATFSPMAAVYVHDRDHIFPCVRCNLVFQGKNDFCNHIGNVYHPRPIQCGECVLSYEHLTSLIRHIKDVHNKPPLPPVAEQLGGENEAEGVAAGAADANQGGNEGGDAVGDVGLIEEQHGDPIEDEDIEIDLAESAGIMVLNLRQSGAITGTAMEKFELECFQMMKNVGTVMRQKVKRFLVSENIDTPASRNLLRELVVEDPFIHIRNLRQQMNYFAQKFGLVKPQTKFLGYRVDYRLNPETAQYEPCQVPMSFEYVPLIETLKLFLSNPKNRESVAAERPSEDGVLRSYLDGRRAKNHPLILRYPNILRLQLYWDDVEVVNALGSKTTIHKIAAFYFSIQNVPLVESGQLSSIYLLALAYSEDLKGQDRFQKVLAPFLYDLRKLESEAGVMIKIDDEPVCLRATLTVLCADTLAAHEILGFLAPSARHFCRKCTVARPLFHQDMNIVAERRTRAMLEEHIRKVKQNPKFSTECGVKATGCPLHLSRTFDATQDAVFDIFHDLLEGVCHWVISLALRCFILEIKAFSLEDFNGRVAAFNYGVPDAKNKPSANFTKDSLKGLKLNQSGCQMWCLTRVFGFLVSDVPASNRHLILVNLLQSILLIVFSEGARNEHIDDLRKKIYDHNKLFQELNVDVGQVPENVAPEENVNINLPEEMVDDPVEAEAMVDDPVEAEAMVDDPVEAEAEEDDDPAAPYKPVKIKPRNKLHQLSHLPDEYLDQGNLIRCWCARYEGRHHIFCKYGAVCCNFINIVKSMAQMFQVATLAGVLKQSHRADEMELQSPQEVAVERSQHSDLLVTLGRKLDDMVLDVDAISIAGEQYRPGLFVITNCTSPTFALIQHVYVYEGEVYFILLPWRTVGFEDRYCAYQVETVPGSQPVILQHAALAKHGALAPWNPHAQRTIYLAPRTIIF